MKSIAFIPSCLILLFTFISSPLQAQQTSKELELRIDSIFQDFQDLEAPGASIAVVKEGNIIFKKGYGSANLEYDIANTPSTVFHIASISKQFTVFSILLLAEQGKLSFDDDIRKYIPEVPDFGKRITLRHLAAHTSGMRDQWNLLTTAGWRMDDVITKEHVLKLVAKQKELNFEPGEEYLYCNTGFTLLAEVVARISGQSFAEFTQANIFEPLKMTNTLFYDDHEKIVKNRAYSYYADNTGYKKSVLSFANVGATSLFTTVEDLSLWAMNFSDIKIGSAGIIKQMNTLATLNNGDTFGGAYGQFVDSFKGVKQIQHGGADAGYRAYFGRFPDQQLAVIVFSNRASANPNALALNVADLFLKKEAAPALSTNETNLKKERVFQQLSSKALEAFSGDYWNEAQSYSRRIYVKNDTLMYSRGGGNESSLAPIGDRIFQMLNVGVDLTVSFKNEGKSKKMVVIINGGTPIISDFYIPANYSAQELRAFTGAFYSSELSTTYTMVVKNGKLIATHPRLSDVALNPVRKDMFLGDQWFFSDIRFERNDSNTITGFRVSTGRVRNLLFEKVN